MARFGAIDRKSDPIEIGAEGCSEQVEGVLAAAAG
jgi:hypothetical protein